MFIYIIGCYRDYRPLIINTMPFQVPGGIPPGIWHKVYMKWHNNVNYIKKFLKEEKAN